MITKTDKGYLVTRGDKINIASENRWIHKKHMIHHSDWIGVYHKTLKSAIIADTMMNTKIPDFISV